MAKARFNFGANAKTRKASKGKSSKKGGTGKGKGGKSQAWRAYVSSAPIPD